MHAVPTRVRAIFAVTDDHVRSGGPTRLCPTDRQTDRQKKVRPADTVTTTALNTA